jgi:D-amino peptidase
MEGVSGITASEEVVLTGKGEYERGRMLLTREVNAAIEGAYEGGADQVIVNEAHSIMRNLFTEELHEGAQVIRGKVKRGCMMEGLDESFSAVFLIGYHAMPGTPMGIMNHAFMGKEVWRISLNGKPVGETEISAAYAGFFDVPVVLLTGDQVVCKEAAENLGQVETVAVKEALGRFTAKILHPAVAREEIRRAARRSLEDLSSRRPYKVDLPATLAIDFTSSAMAEVNSWLPTVERTGPRSIQFQFEDWTAGMGLLNAITWLARRVSDPVFC